MLPTIDKLHFDDVHGLNFYESLFYYEHLREIGKRTQQNARPKRALGP
jgi:hypothetical protein